MRTHVLPLLSLGALVALGATAVGITRNPSGAPFAVGPWYAPTELLGATARWSGGQENGYAPGLRRMLDSLRTSKARVVLSTLRGKMKNADGTLSIDKFRTEIGKWAAAADVASYFSDGTIIAINVMDDNATAWTVPVTPAQVDSLAQIVKQTWPNAVVSTRTTPAQLGSYVFKYLDMAWAQYSGPYRDGTPQQYRDTQVAGAKARGLGLVLSLNVLDGGCGSPTSACLSGIPGTDIWGTYENAARSAAVPDERRRASGVRQGLHCRALQLRPAAVAVQRHVCPEGLHDGRAVLRNREFRSADRRDRSLAAARRAGKGAHGRAVSASGVVIAVYFGIRERP